MSIIKSICYINRQIKESKDILILIFLFCTKICAWNDQQISTNDPTYFSLVVEMMCEFFSETKFLKVTKGDYLILLLGNCCLLEHQRQKSLF